MDDPFVQGHDAAELDIAGEFLTNWLPFLTRNLCPDCSQTLTDRIRSLRPDPSPGSPNSTDQIERCGSCAEPIQDPNLESPMECRTPYSGEHIEATGWGTDPEPDADRDPTPARMSWADMAQEEDELAMEEERATERSEEVKEAGKKKVELSRKQREWIRFNNVGRKKDFICLERVKGKIVNILEGLELHTGVFSAVEQKRIVDFVYELQEKGRKGELAERTYSEPQKWMRGKGRVTIQFGCCYNYAMDKDGNPPGILRNDIPDPFPSLFKVIVKRLVRWHVLPTSCVPDSCIVNIYEPEDCIPPHIDSHDFVRPFCTVSFLSECNIVFGTSLKIEGPGEFSGSTAIPLPVGSVLVLNGNGADVAKHCVPAVPTKRISITFRKMDDSKLPYSFTPDPDLQNILPLQTNNNEKQSRSASQSSRNAIKHTRNPGAPEIAPPNVRPRQVIDVRSAPTSKGLIGRAPEMTTPVLRPRQVIDVRSGAIGNSSADRPLDSRSRSSSQDGRRLQDTDSEPVWRNRQQDWSDDAEVESGRRRVRVEQKRIVISRSIEGEEASSLAGGQSVDWAPQSRRNGSGGLRRSRVVLSDD